VRGPLVFRIVPPAVSLTLSELESQVANRRPVDSPQRADIAESYAALRKRYADQSRRAQRQFADPRIKQPGAAALFHLAVESVKASRLVYTALQEADQAVRSGDMWVASPEVVERAIDWNRQKLDRLEGQLRILDLLDDVLPPLKKLSVQLEKSRHVSALGWQSIARHILSEAGRAADGASILPLPGFSLRAYLAQAGHGFFGDAFSRGIETVLVLAPILASRDTESNEIDVLTIASLCQDSGLMLLARQRGAVGGKNVDGGDAHASVSAGLVAGIAEFAAQIPSLVAEHHRRLIGFDRVPDLATAVQKTGSRLLATTVRFLEIVDEMAWNAGEERPEAALYPAAIRLVNETGRGEWDPKIAAELLSGIGFQLRCEAVEESGEERFFGRTAFGIRRRDPGDPNLPDPNFLLVHEAPAERYVRPTSR
jgi:hypothetical protein